MIPQSTPHNVLLTSTNCYRCGGTHSAAICPYKEATCHKCSKRGHIAKACKSRKKSTKPTTHSNSKIGTSKPPKPTNQITSIESEMETPNEGNHHEENHTDQPDIRG